MFTVCTYASVVESGDHAAATTLSISGGVARTVQLSGSGVPSSTGGSSLADRANARRCCRHTGHLGDDPEDKKENAGRAEHRTHVIGNAAARRSLWGVTDRRGVKARARRTPSCGALV